MVHEPDGSGRRSRGRRAPGVQRYALLIAAGCAVYFGGLWFGVAVVGDTVPRSIVMAGVILALAAAGYHSIRRPVERKK